VAAASGLRHDHHANIGVSFPAGVAYEWLYGAFCGERGAMRGVGSCWRSGQQLIGQAALAELVVSRQAVERAGKYGPDRVDRVFRHLEDPAIIFDRGLHCVPPTRDGF
jgi:hypothetical protein